MQLLAKYPQSMIEFLNFSKTVEKKDDLIDMR